MNKDSFQKLEVSDLTIQFRNEDGLIQPVDHVSFEINQGEHVGLIGESGCGKTVTALALLGFERDKPGIVEGRVRLNGTDLLPKLTELFGNEQIAQKKLRNWRKWQKELTKKVTPFRGTVLNIAFQKAEKMLDPLFTVGKQIAEAAVLSDLTRKWSKSDRKAKACEWLFRVEMSEPEKVFLQYPHQLSGGELQRVVMAIALAAEPDLLVADEPTNALDVTVASKILLLLKKLCDEEGLTLLVVTHDLAAIRELTQKVLVMYAGQIVEVLTTNDISSGEIFHPYTQALMNSQITEDMIKDKKKLHAISGEVPKPDSPIKGCRFHPRCPLENLETEQQAVNLSTGSRSRQDFGSQLHRCSTKPPELDEFKGHLVRCWEYYHRGDAS